MFEQDYLMRLIMQLIEAIKQSMIRAQDDHDPASAALLLEEAVSTTTDLDGSVLLNLAPSSIADILSISNMDKDAIQYVGRSFYLISRYWQEAGDTALASLRKQQAMALSDRFGFDLNMEDIYNIDNDPNTKM